MNPGESLIWLKKEITSITSIFKYREKGTTTVKKEQKGRVEVKDTRTDPRDITKKWERRQTLDSVRVPVTSSTCLEETQLYGCDPHLLRKGNSDFTFILGL